MLMTVHVKNWHAPSCSSEASLSTFLHFEALFGSRQQFIVIENKDEKDYAWLPIIISFD